MTLSSATAKRMRELLDLFAARPEHLRGEAHDADSRAELLACLAASMVSTCLRAAAARVRRGAAHPGGSAGPGRVTRRVVTDLDAALADRPSSAVSSLQSRQIKISRGCTCGCRFCRASSTAGGERSLGALRCRPGDHQRRLRRTVIACSTARTAYHRAARRPARAPRPRASRRRPRRVDTFSGLASVCSACASGLTLAPGLAAPARYHQHDITAEDHSARRAQPSGRAAAAQASLRDRSALEPTRTCWLCALIDGCSRARGAACAGGGRLHQRERQRLIPCRTPSAAGDGRPTRAPPPPAP